MTAPDTSSYVLVTPDTADLPNSVTLAASGGLKRDNTGPGNFVTITTTGNLANLNAFNMGGFVNYNTLAQQFVPITFEAGTGISITNPDGQSGDTSFSVIPNSSVQRVIVQNNGVVITPSGRPALNFIAGPNTSVAIADNPGNGTADITLSLSTSGAPETATYITKHDETGTLPNSQPLSPLSTGLMKVTTGTGIISTAVGNTDYQEASPKLTAISGLTAENGSLIVGDGGSYSELDIAPSGYVLTSSGTSASWEPNQSGHPFPVVNSRTTAQVLALPNTFYSVGGTTSGVILPGNITPLPNFGDQFLISSCGASGTIVIVPNAISGTTPKFGSAGSLYISAVTTPGEYCFIWFMYVGIISGIPIYQVLSLSNNISLTP